MRECVGKCGDVWASEGVCGIHLRATWQAGGQASAHLRIHHSQPLSQPQRRMQPLATAPYRLACGRDATPPVRTQLAPRGRLRIPA